jgi:hypothetical protein
MGEGGRGGSRKGAGVRKGRGGERRGYEGVRVGWAGWGGRGGSRKGGGGVRKGRGGLWLAERAEGPAPRQNNGSISGEDSAQSMTRIWPNLHDEEEQCAHARHAWATADGLSSAHISAD